MAEVIYPSEDSVIRAAVDRAGTLPAIYLEPITSFKPEPLWPFEHITSADSYAIYGEENRVGEAVILRSLLGYRYFTRVHIKNELRGQGYGLAAYVLAIEDAHRHGDTFRNDPVGTYEPAVKMWQCLLEKGVAKEEEALHRRSKARGREESGLFIGRLSVPPPNTLHT